MNKDRIIEIVNAGNKHCYGKPLRKLLCFPNVIAANSVICTQALYSRAVQYYYSSNSNHEYPVAICTVAEKIAKYHDCIIRPDTRNIMHFRPMVLSIEQ